MEGAQATIRRALTSTSDIVQAVQTANRDLATEISRLSRRALRSQDDDAIAELSHLLAVSGPQHVKREAVLRNFNLELGYGFSFWSEVLLSRIAAAQGEQRYLGGALNPKLRGYRFADTLGVRRPEVSDAFRFEDLPLLPNTIIKPENGTGSRGCYLWTAPDTWRHVRTGETLQGPESLREHALSLMSPNPGERPLRNSWRYEELIWEDDQATIPARDVKFYTFYGEIAFGLEIRRHPQVLTRHFLADTNETIHPLSLRRTTFEGLGASQEEIALVEQISSAIPSPFMRIDMLRSSEGLVLGEFTPKPGTVAHFTPEWDRAMGKMWRNAQNRLTRDLLDGVNFFAFREATK